MARLTAQATRDIGLGSGGSYSVSRDAIKHQIWDTRFFQQAVIDFTFFSQPIGSPWRLGQKSLTETNIYNAGQLPNGQTFLARRMGIGLLSHYLQASTNAADIAQAFVNLMQSSVFEVLIRGRDFDFQIHGRQFLPSPIALYSDTASTVNAIRVGDMLASGWVTLDPAPIFIDQLVNFSVLHRLGNPDAQVTTILNADSSLLNGTYGDLQVTLEGFLTRAK